MRKRGKQEGGSEREGETDFRDGRRRRKKICLKTLHKSVPGGGIRHHQNQKLRSYQKRKGRNQLTGGKGSTISASSFTNITMQSKASTLLCRNWSIETSKLSTERKRTTKKKLNCRIRDEVVTAAADNEDNDDDDDDDYRQYDVVATGKVKIALATHIIELWNCLSAR
ncbi:uncharacterized protein LOC128250345 [Octopus bimaculoides]|uniref:uncharacterized protein LOC128250345 n=1 Tax=Octopus bimaculoides TaxID=37653 RepID=UPI0022E106AD|nr:uncharacterized protein LOC128250345 [Octopus bimaculoides]